MPTGGCSVRPFDEATLVAILGRHTGAVRYLFDYLTELDARSIVLEDHYIDRHYLEDFARYYSKSFSPPVAHCSRLHFFTLDPLAIDALLTRSCEGNAGRIEAESVLAPRGEGAQQHYLGFIVKRPLADAALGRTVLKTYPVDGRRHYPVIRDYHVHLLGLHLRVEGLAYQQQDRGAAVCASTALWSALQQVARMAGHRTPAPSEITLAAGSPFPAAHGLDGGQMATAIAKLGYIADAFFPADNLPLFRAKVVSCLDSQLPVIIVMQQGSTGHAICLTGFSEPRDLVKVSLHSGVAISMRGASADVIYVHDDNLGSHAHYEFYDVLIGNLLQKVLGLATPRQMLRRGRSNEPPVPWWNVDDWQVLAALVPKPEELRLSIDSLFTIVVEFRTVNQLALPNVDVNYALRFSSGAKYKESIIDWGFGPTELRAFYARASLPRHVGVISTYQERRHLFDTLVDASEVERIQQQPTILGLVAPGVPEQSFAGAAFRAIGNVITAPVLLAP